MGRLRLTQVFPFLIPLRQKQRKFLFYKGMEKDNYVYAREQISLPLTHKIFESQEKMVNENSGFPIKYQYNKVDNLKLAAEVLNGLVIKPRETFSFWQLIHQVKKPFKSGLILVNGKMTEAEGGGLCQISNLLYWGFLHSPLTVIERTAHDIEAFFLPDKLYGVDATISEGWLDLKMKNETDTTFQIAIDFPQGENIRLILLADKEPTEVYEIYNENNEVFKQGEQNFRKVDIWRRRNSLVTPSKQAEYLYTDTVKIGYQLEGVQ